MLHQEEGGGPACYTRRREEAGIPQVGSSTLHSRPPRYPPTLHSRPPGYTAVLYTADVMLSVHGARAGMTVIHLFSTGTAFKKSGFEEYHLAGKRAGKGLKHRKCTTNTTARV